MVALPQQGRQAAITVYFKLDRGLGLDHHVVVSVDGVVNLDTTGHGYDASRGRCDYKLLEILTISEDEAVPTPRWLKRLGCKAESGDPGQGHMR